MENREKGKGKGKGNIKEKCLIIEAKECEMENNKR